MIMVKEIAECRLKLTCLLSWPRPIRWRKEEIRLLVSFSAWIWVILSYGRSNVSIILQPLGYTHEDSQTDSYSQFSRIQLAYWCSGQDEFLQECSLKRYSWWFGSCYNNLVYLECPFGDNFVEYRVRPMLFFILIILKNWWSEIRRFHFTSFRFRDLCHSPF